MSNKVKFRANWPDNFVRGDKVARNFATSPLSFSCNLNPWHICQLWQLCQIEVDWHELYMSTLSHFGVFVTLNLHENESGVLTVATLSHFLSLCHL